MANYTDKPNPGYRVWPKVNKGGGGKKGGKRKVFFQHPGAKVQSGLIDKATNIKPEKVVLKAGKWKQGHKCKGH